MNQESASLVHTFFAQFVLAAQAMDALPDDPTLENLKAFLTAEADHLWQDFELFQAASPQEAAPIEEAEIIKD